MPHPPQTSAPSRPATITPPADGLTGANPWGRPGDPAGEPPPRELPFLGEDYLAQTCGWLKMAPEVIQALMQAAACLREQEPLRRLLWQCHQALIRSCPAAAPDTRPWPALPGDYGLAGDLFYALALLSAVPAIRQWHEQRGIPTQVTLDTLADLELWIREYHHRYGRWGLEEVVWLVHHWQGRLYRLGQLQFALGTFPHDFHGLRHRATGRVILLAGDGMRFGPEGQFAGVGSPGDAPGGWVARFAQGPTVLEGHLISPHGMPDRNCRRWPGSEWVGCLQRGDPILEVHIPAIGPLSADACAASFAAAREFFPRYFPEYRYVAFTSDTWLFDPQLEKYLPAESNIIRFQREFYLFPQPHANGRQILERVWGVPVPSLAQAPGQTRLQAAVGEHLRQGGQWHTTGGFLLPADLAWGRQPYRHSPTNQP